MTSEHDAGHDPGDTAHDTAQHGGPADHPPLLNPTPAEETTWRDRRAEESDLRPADLGPTTPKRVDPAKRRAELAAELAELDRQAAEQGEEPAEPTHVLVLANGDTVKVSGHASIATHHDVGTKDDPQVVPVVSCYALK